MATEIIFTIVLIFIVIGINCYILKKSGMFIKENMLFLILILIGMINFGVFAYNSIKIGMHVVLTDGYIQNGEYFVSKLRRIGAGTQISQWNYNFNIIISKCLMVTFPIALISSLVMSLKLYKINKNK